MTRLYIYITTLLISLTGINTSAQERRTIVQELNTSKPRQGNIRIYIDPGLRNIPGVTVPWETLWNNQNLLLQRGDSLYTPNLLPPNSSFVKRQGFKVQLFAGNNPRQAKNEAVHKEQLFKEKFPHWSTSLTYQAPYWRLRVGDFITREEAESARKEITKAFPSFGKEIYVVKSEISVIE